MSRPFRLPAALPLLACLVVIAGASPGGARAASCVPGLALAAPDAAPTLLAVRRDAGRVHFLKDTALAPGCPGPAPYCLDPGFVAPGDAVVVTGTTPGYVCATAVTGAGGAPVSGWLPRASLGPAPAAPAATAADWTGEWQSGPEQSISITPDSGGAIMLRGSATFGARDASRVRRGAVNTGEFVAAATPEGGKLAFLVGGDGNALPYDAERARTEGRCALRFWRLGAYLIMVDNQQCGGANVTFTGVYSRAGKPG